MSDEVKKRMKRVEFIGILRKWIRAFQDDVLAEQAAIDLYVAHIGGFFGEFFRFVLSSPLAERPILSKVEDRVVSETSKYLQEELGVPSDGADEIANRLRVSIIGSPLVRGQAHQDQSVRHIALEEKEHITEFSTIIEDVTKIIGYLKKAPVL